MKTFLNILSNGMIVVGVGGAVVTAGLLIYNKGRHDGIRMLADDVIDMLHKMGGESEYETEEPKE